MNKPEKPNIIIPANFAGIYILTTFFNLDIRIRGQNNEKRERKIIKIFRDSL